MCAAGLALQLSVSFVYTGASGAEMVSGFADAALYYGSAIAAASTTVLGLLFTVIGLARNAEVEFEPSLYRRVARLALFCVLSLIGSIVLLLVLCVPIGEFDALPKWWYGAIYRVIATLVAVLAGLSVTIVLVLFAAVRQVLRSMTPLDGMWGGDN